MAKVFLSYAREDAAAAKQLAECIGRAGHQVWWDHQIEGGSRFSAEIDRELKNCDAVVVIWTKASIESPWVQDEAAEGRDTGRLVPVILGTDKPPLGFRQFQSIDFGDWNGEGGPAGARGADPRDRPEGRRAAGRAGEAASRPARARARRTSICVLPFVNMSGDPEQEYFSDGITEDIITDLSKVSALSVVARNTAFTFKGQALDVKEVAEKLGVDHVLEGSVRKAGNRVRITAQLIDGKKGDHSGPTATTATSPTSSPSRTRFRRRSSRALQVEAAARGRAGDRDARHRQRRSLQPLPDGAAAMDLGKLGQYPPRRDHRPHLPAGDDVRSRLCPGLGADGAGAGRAALLARQGRRSASGRRTGAGDQSQAGRSRIASRSRYSRADRPTTTRPTRRSRKRCRLGPEFLGGEPRSRAADVPPRPHGRCNPLFRKGGAADGHRFPQLPDAADLLSWRRRRDQLRWMPHGELWNAPKWRLRRTRRTVPRSPPAQAP